MLKNSIGMKVGAAQTDLIFVAFIQTCRRACLRAVAAA